MFRLTWWLLLADHIDVQQQNEEILPLLHNALLDRQPGISAKALPSSQEATVQREISRSLQPCTPVNKGHAKSLVV